jgi:cytochrome c-type biogenesis protein CcmH/NrfG
MRSGARCDEGAVGDTKGVRRARDARGGLARAAVAALAVLMVAGFASSAKAAPAKEKTTTTTAAADSVHQLEMAAQKDTNSFEKSYRLGVAYLDRDRPLEAVGAFARATRLRPKEVKAWVNLGAAHDALGRGNDARVAYRHALSLDPTDEIALCRIGASLYAGGLKPAAMDTLRMALKQHPNSYCTYFTLGVAFADAQIYHEAIRAWQKVLDLAPNSPEAVSAKESIQTLQELMKTP